MTIRVTPLLLLTQAWTRLGSPPCAQVTNAPTLSASAITAAPTLKRSVLSDMCFPFEAELRQAVHTSRKHSRFERLCRAADHPPSVYAPNVRKPGHGLERPAACADQCNRLKTGTADQYRRCHSLLLWSLVSAHGRPRPFSPEPRRDPASSQKPRTGTTVGRTSDGAP